ncbi:MAG TPA: AraC family transcriptional regulator [Blastocatellia bacterium]|nr:AraC family transcriptional regulator [Blastocatellia bacterium]
MHPKVQRVIDYTNANLHRKLDLINLGRLAGLSRSRLCYVFKNEMGISLGKYLKAQRMQKARELLERTSLNAKEVAAAVGMRDQSHFSKDFKRTYDLTPLQYRAQFFTNDQEE